jgi:hypothetical protein
VCRVSTQTGSAMARLSEAWVFGYALVADVGQKARPDNGYAGLDGPADRGSSSPRRWVSVLATQSHVRPGTSLLKREPHAVHGPVDQLDRDLATAAAKRLARRPVEGVDVLLRVVIEADADRTVAKLDPRSPRSTGRLTVTGPRTLPSKATGVSGTFPECRNRPKRAPPAIAQFHGFSPMGGAGLEPATSCL